MSQLIQGLSELEQEEQHTDLNHITKPIKQRIIRFLARQETNFSIQVPIQQTCPSHCVRLSFIGDRINKFIELGISVDIDFLQRKFKMKSILIVAGQRFLARSKNCRLEIMRFILKYMGSRQSDLCSYILDPQTGLLELEENSQYSQSILGEKQVVIRLISERLTEHIRINNKFAIGIIRMANELPVNYFDLKYPEKMQLEDTKLTQLIKNITLSHVHMALSQKYESSKFPGQAHDSQSSLLLGQNGKGADQNSQVYKNLINGISGELMDSLSYSNLLFLPNPIIIDQQMYDSQNFPCLQQYSNYLTNPAVKSKSSSGSVQNKFISNQIQVLNTQNIYLKLQNTTGAFSDIYVSKVFFQYVYQVEPKSNLKVAQTRIQATEQEQSPSKGSKFVKFLALKMAKKKSKESSNQHSITKSKYRIDHEQNILSLFKNLSSPYFLKYYNSNQADFQYKEAIMMQYAHNIPNLLQFLEDNASSVSLKTKMLIMGHLSNAIRFLKYSDIVHMDLNLSNILVMPDGIVKIIDFGESFHPKVCDKDYMPGYTLPYCPPQVFDYEKKRSLYHQSDMFSFGTILFRFLFDRHAFYPGKSLVRAYKEKNYNNLFYCVPENLECYGKQKIVRSLLFLCSKCFDSDHNLRPIATWVTICIRQYISII